MEKWMKRFDIFAKEYVSGQLFGKFSIVWFKATIMEFSQKIKLSDEDGFKWR